MLEVAGLASPATTPIEAWAEATRPGDPALRAQALELLALADAGTNRAAARLARARGAPDARYALIAC